MVRVVSRIGSGTRKARTKFKARTQLQLSNGRFWIFLVGIGIAIMAASHLVVAYLDDKNSVILLPTEEGPKKVFVPASEAFVLNKPEVCLSLVEITEESLIFSRSFQIKYYYVESSTLSPRFKANLVVVSSNRSTS